MRLPFAPEPETASNAWDWVIRGIRGADNVLRPARAQFVSLMSSGRPLSAIDRHLAAQLAELRWEWPLLEQWRASFREVGEVPYLWRHSKNGTLQQANWADNVFPEPGAVTVALISHTASMATYHLRSVSQGLTEKGLSDKRLRVSLTGDAAEDRVAVAGAPTLYLNPHGDLPPFFPGDRTGLQWVTKRSAERYGWAW